MARILITGSSDGLGKLTAQRLIRAGHTVYLHARSAGRASEATAATPGAAGVLVADLSKLAEVRAMAGQMEAEGPFDAVVHNAGLYLGPFRATDGGYPSLFAVNVLAPFLLTCLAPLPRARLVYVTSGLHTGGQADFQRDFGGREAGERGWRDMKAYSDSKLYNVMFAKAFGRRLADRGVVATSVDPGWVPTKMGGASASDDLDAAVRTYAMCAEGTGAAAGQNANGKSFYQEAERSTKSVASDLRKQDELLEKLEEITGVKVPF